jgi:hypothetical protein
MIYFVLDTVVRAIKIGYSKEPQKRLGALQTANPNKLDILGTIPGTEKDEEQLHIKFGEHRLKGEWFKGDEIFESVMEMITASRNARTVRQVSRNMNENPDTPDANPTNGSGPAVDPDSKMEGGKPHSGTEDDEVHLEADGTTRATASREGHGILRLRNQIRLDLRQERHL